MDVVVTDMRMPLMDGAELLQQVQQRWPGTIRIVLSGHSDAGALARIVDVAHQFLAKPCENAMPLEKVGTAVAQRSLFKDPAVAAAVGRVGRLPAAPTLFSRIRRLLCEPGSDMREIAKLIASDPALGAKVVQLANSACFGSGKAISDVHGAIARLDIEQVNLPVLASQVFCGDGALADRLQRQALVAATLAARISGKDGAAATAALLAHVGLLIPGLADEAGEGPRAGAEPIRSTTPTHSAVAAYLLAMWGLPMEIVAAVARQHDPARANETGFGMAGVVLVAVTLAAGEPPDVAYLAEAGVLDRLPGWQAMARETGQSGD